MSLKGKKVVSILLNNFINDSRVLKECISLKRQGCHVRVLALYEKGLKKVDNVAGITVCRIELKSRVFPKIKSIQFIKYLEFTIRAIREIKNVDIYHCNDLNTLPVGIFLKIFLNKKAKVIYDAHEYETERYGLKSYEKAMMRLLERFLIKYVDKVLTVSDSIANEYSRLYNIVKPELVLNCPPIKQITAQNRFRESLGIRDDQTIFLYQGGLSNGRGIPLLLDAFSCLTSNKDVIVIMGYGIYEGLIKEHDRQYRTIYFHPAVSPEILLNYTASADYGILFYEDTCLNHRYCSPNKIFEYLMAGIPVITSNLVEMKRLVEAYKIGVVASDNTVSGLIDAVTQVKKLNYKELSRNVLSAKIFLIGKTKKEY